MSKNIVVELNDKKYTLGFSRTTVVNTIKNGFDPDFLIQTGQKDTEGTFSFTDNILMLDEIYKLFRGAFMLYHPKIKEAEVSAIWDEIPDKMEILKPLFDAFSEPLNVLADHDDEGDRGKAVWRVDV